MKKKFKVAGIGEILWDLLPSGKQIGGAPFNFAFHASQVGCISYVISAVGKDLLGSEILHITKGLGFDIQYIQKNDYPTSTVVVKLDTRGQPDFTILENVAWDHIYFDVKIKQLAKEIDAICFGSLAQRNLQSEATINSILESLRDDCLKVFDINLRQNYYTSDIIRRSLEIADILKLNENELPVLKELFGLSGEVDTQLDELIKRFNLSTVAYTMGREGSMLLSGEARSIMKPVDVKVVDSVGAGDAFTAILVAGILNGKQLAEIHKTASHIASYICTKEGATPIIPQNLIDKLL